jgi:hypothetical protein
VLLVSRDSERERESRFPVGERRCRPCSFLTVWRNTPETTTSKLLFSKGSLLTSPSLEIRSAGFEREQAGLQRLLRSGRWVPEQTVRERESVVDGRRCRISGRKEQGRQIPTASKASKIRSVGTRADRSREKASSMGADAGFPVGRSKGVGFRSVGEGTTF